ncbi:MAG: DUF3344 domain-containing protein, partial [Methanoregula sp.]|nr:DUF3344 domain-containing protein [Methanoregula sp.]
KLVYGWNVASGSTGTTKYWVNEGMDPMTKNIGTYIDNKTWFMGTDEPDSYTAKLWVNYLASPGGAGTYTWNGNLISPTPTQGTYAGLQYLTWTGLPVIQENNVLTYSRTNNWYKNIVSVFTLR